MWSRSATRARWSPASPNCWKRSGASKRRFEAEPLEDVERRRSIGLLEDGDPVEPVRAGLLGEVVPQGAQNLLAQVLVADLAGERHVEAEVLEHIGIAPGDEPRVLLRRQRGLAPAGQVLLAQRGAEGIEG